MNAEYVTETLSANLSDRLAVCRAEVAKLREENERLLAANRYSLDMFNMINADYQKARAENDRYRAEVDSLTVANANYETNVSAMWADYKGAVADRERYRAALVEITNRSYVEPSAPYWSALLIKAEQIALNALATRTESGPLSGDSGPIAGYSALRGVDDHQPQKSNSSITGHIQTIAEDGK